MNKDSRAQSTEITSFNSELENLDIENISVEELERRLELAIGVLVHPQPDDCTAHSCGAFGCGAHSCGTDLTPPPPPPPTGCGMYLI